MRQILSVLIPLLLPTLLYFLYVTAAGRRAKAAGGAVGERPVPWTWLAVAGGLLVVVTFVAVALFGGADPGRVYHPPRTIDGRIERGYFE